MSPEDESGLSDYQFQVFSKDQLADTEILTALCDFYNEATSKENTDKIYTVEEFSQEVLRNTLEAEGGKIVFATNQNRQICGFVAGYNTDFNQQNFRLKKDVPKGKYFYMFGLGSTTGDPSVVLGLSAQLLAGVDADYCVGLVSHSAPIYRREIYPRRGWTEVESSLPIAQEKSYFYISRQEVIK